MGWKPSHVLGRVDGIDHVLIGNMFGQGQLDQDTVDIDIIIQFFNDVEQFVLANALFEADEGGFIANFGAGLHFGAHVGLAGAVVAYQDCGQMGQFFSFCDHLCHF